MVGFQNWKNYKGQAALTLVAVGIHHFDLLRGGRDLSAGGNCLIVTSWSRFRTMLPKRSASRLLNPDLRHWRTQGRYGGGGGGINTSPSAYDLKETQISHHLALKNSFRYSFGGGRFVSWVNNECKPKEETVHQI